MSSSTGPPLIQEHEEEAENKTEDRSFEVREIDIRKKLKNLSMSKINILKETSCNELVGDGIYRKLRKCLDITDYEKVANYSEEVEKITNLLLSLSSRLIKCDMSLGGSDKEQKVTTPLCVIP